MIIYRSPFRISLYGGGSDYKEFIDKNGHGLCIGFAIDKYSYISVRELPSFFPYKTRLVYSETEIAQDNRYINHNAIRSAIQYLAMDDFPLEIIHSSDLPAKTGLGTSSSFIVSLVSSLYELRNNKPLLRPADVAYDIEYYMMKNNVGLQDHLFAEKGGAQVFIFKNNIIVHELTDKLKPLIEKYGLLFYTGISRNSSEVVGNYIGSLADHPAQKGILSIAEEAYKEITGLCDVQKLGRLLTQSWDFKKQISPFISTSRIDWLMEIARQIGCLGQKLCGGGGGGCIFLLADTYKHEELIQFFKDEQCTHISFKVAERGCEKIL